MLLDQYDAVLFDLDGTLANTDPARKESTRQIRLQYADVLPKPLNEAELLDADLLELQLHHLERFAVKERDKRVLNIVTEIRNERRKIYIALIVEQVEPMSGANEIVVAMQEEKKYLGLVTNASTGNVTAVGERIHLRGFHTVVTRENVRSRKPHPEGIQTALEHIGIIHDRIVHARRTMRQKVWRFFGGGKKRIAPQRALYIGNAIEDMLAAKAAGTQRALVNAAPDEQLLDEVDGRVFANMHELLAYLRS